MFAKITLTSKEIFTSEFISFITKDKMLDNTIKYFKRTY